MLARQAAVFSRGAPSSLVRARRPAQLESAFASSVTFAFPAQKQQQQQQQQRQRLFSTTRLTMSTSDAAAGSNTSGVTAESLKTALATRVGAQHVEVEDLSGGCGQAFNAIIVSPQFDQKTMLARHRLVNSALKDEIAAIHAWTPKCFTPEQWEKQKEKEQQER